jgi:hypothetical protein
MKQTAVEWFAEQMITNGKLTPELFEQAKEKEFRQITNAYESGNFDGFNHQSIDYYKETFESEEKEIEF